MKRISHIISYLFEDRFIISLSKEWLGVLGETPKFDVMIDSEKRLHLISKQG